MITVGIDPGLGGAIGILNNGEYQSLFDMPTVIKGGSGSVKYEVSSAAIKGFLRAEIGAMEACNGIIERVNSRPGQAASTTFSLGDSFGSARAVFACCGIPYRDVTPAKWKKHFGLSSDKEQSRALASKLFPTAPLHLKKYHDRAEALLLARYLWEIEFK